LSWGYQAFGTEATFTYGDGTLAGNATQRNVINFVIQYRSANLVVGRASFKHIYSLAESGATVYQAEFAHCCRASELMNNQRTFRRVRTTLSLEQSASSPRLAAVATIEVGRANDTYFYIPAVSVRGSPLRYALGTPLDFGAGLAGVPLGVAINEFTGKITWDTTNVHTGDWSLLVKVPVRSVFNQADALHAFRLGHAAACLNLNPVFVVFYSTDLAWWLWLWQNI